MNRTYDCADVHEFRAALTTELQNSYNEQFKPTEVRVFEYKDTVSRAQQKFIFGVIVPRLWDAYSNAGVDKADGLTRDEFELVLRSMFHARPFTDPVSGEMKWAPKRLAFGQANREEVSNYINKLMEHACALGVDIPSPDFELTKGEDNAINE